MITFSKIGQHGRLGNQLFQYAALRGAESATGFEAVVPPGFDIEGMNLRCRRVQIKPRHLHEERKFAFDPSVLAIADNTDLHGYFQSWRYFERVATLVAREFALVEAPVKLVTRAIETWRGTSQAELVGIHVRRGDYLSHPRIHPVRDAAWYAHALQALPPAATGRARRFVVCSDDLAWCREALRGLGDVVFSDGLAPVEDLGVLVRCDHVVISNSSFGWWGAWLGARSSRVVVAPSQWFGPDGRQDTQDLIPPSWRVA